MPGNVFSLNIYNDQNIILRRKQSDNTWAKDLNNLSKMIYR